MLKTGCSGCQWMIGINSGCRFDKNTDIQITNDIEYQYTYGFCRHKRLKAWADKNIKTEEPEDYIVSIINKEENNLSAIVLFNNIQDTKKTLTSIINTNGYVSQIIVCAKNQEDAVLKELANMLEDSKLTWSIDHITEKDDIEDALLVNYCSRLVKPHWFIVLKAGDIISENMINEIKSWMNATTANFVGFYVDENDYIRILTNKFAFRQLAGNADKPWLEKVKADNDWKNICLRIVN